MSDYEQVNEQPTEEMPGKGTRSPINEFLRHQQRAFEETGKAVESLLPPGFREHSTEAGREFVSGFKVLFDAVLDGVQKVSRDFDQTLKQERGASGESGDRPSSTGATKVKVQVD